MPLSEEELRQLEQMERALVAEDPKFVSTIRGTSMQRHARRRMIVAAVAFVVGITVLMTGAVMQRTLIGILGFVLMLVSAYVGLVAWRGRNAAAEASEQPAGREEPFGLSLIEGGRKRRRPRRTPGAKPPKSSPARGHGSFMHRMEERWRRRRDELGGF